MLKKLRTVSGSGIKRMLNVSSKKWDEIRHILKIVYHYSLYKTRYQFTYNIYNISTTSLCLNEKLDIISDGSEYLYEWNIINIIPDESECLYCMRNSLAIPECLNEKLDIISDGSEYRNIINIIPDENECLYCMRIIMPFILDILDERNTCFPDEMKPII